MFDGDEMNIFLAQSVQARNELKRIAGVQYQIVGAKDSSPIIGCQQDTLTGAYMLTDPSVRIKGWELANILCNTTSDTKFEVDMNKEYTGHEAFSHIIPAGINNIKKSGDKIIIQIVDGKLIAGFLDKSSLSFAKNSIIHFIWDKFGPSKTRRFIDDSQKFVLNYLLLRGQTVGFKDTVTDETTYNQIQQIITNKVLSSKYQITQFENDIEQVSLETIESSLLNELSPVQTEVGQILMSKMGMDNFFWAGAKSGGKGDPGRVAQVSGILGQQTTQGERIKKKLEGRSLIYFHRDDDTPEARGFVKNSFFSGLRGFEFFYNAMGGREGLIDTAIKSVTWETPIVIIENNVPKYTMIGKWIDNMLANNSDQVEHHTERQMELLNIKDTVYIPTTDYNGNVTWGPVSAITRHDPGTELYEIKTSGGRSVIVTESKSLLIWNPVTKQFKEMLTPDIKVGDCVPVTAELCTPPTIQRFIGNVELNNMNGIIIGLYLAKGKINNYVITDDLSRLLKQLDNHIPDEAFIAPEEFVVGLLSGYYTSNSSIKNANNYIEIKSKSKRLLEGISMLCSRIGVFGKVMSNSFRISAQWAKKFSEKVVLLEENKNTKMKAKVWARSHQNFQVFNDVVLDNIVEINLIDVKLHPKVYDLTIPTTFNFGLANGLQVRDTAQTGYISRQLIKGLEDLVIRYDGTNRNAKGIIIQTVYGENGINQSLQTEVVLNILNMNNKTLEEKLGLSDEHIKTLEKDLKIPAAKLKEHNKSHNMKLISLRDEMRTLQTKALINYKILEEKYVLPINLFRITQDFTNMSKETKKDLDPMFVADTIEDFLNDYDYRLITSLKKTDKFMKEDDRSLKFLLEVALNEYLSPKKCIFDYNLSKANFLGLMKDIKMSFIKAIVEPGEMVGIVAAQSIGEPTSQMNLNTKHFAGVAGKSSANMGVNRIQELLHFSKNIKTPQMTIYFKEEYSKDRSKLNKIVSYFKFLSIRQLISSAEIYYDLGLNDELSKKIKADNVSNPFFINNMKADVQSLPFVFRIKMDIEKMMDKETTLLDIKTKFISHWYKNYTNIKNMKKNEKDVVTNISRCAILSNNVTDKEQIIQIRFSMGAFNYNIITEFLRMVFDDISLKGIENIMGVDVAQERMISYNKDSGDVVVDKEYVVYTAGINFEKMRMIKGIDLTRTKCNDVATILRLYGIEATRQILINELTNTFGNNNASINHNHLSLLVDQMCYLGEIVSIDRHGMNKIDMDPLARASFEKTMEHFVNAAIFNEKDTMKSLSSRISVGRVINGGTGCFDLLLDTKKLENSEYTEDETGGRITFVPLEEDPLLLDIVKYDVGKTDFFVPDFKK
jgi:DNA-directed RNA polymerase beta' subunit